MDKQKVEAKKKNEDEGNLPVLLRWVLTHHIARRSWVLVVPPMESTIVGPRASENRVALGYSVGGTNHIGYDAMQPDDFGLQWVRAG